MPLFYTPGELAQANLRANIMCFGDSWFAHPVANLSNTLDNIHRGDAILVLGDAGLEASDMVDPNQRYLAMFKEELIASEFTLKRVYLSAGGNDFAGWDDFAAVLKADCSACNLPADCYDVDALRRLFTQIFGDIKTMIDLVRQHAPNAEIRLHNYDYAIPNGKVKVGGGKWLKTPMDACKVPNRGGLARGGFRREVVATLIDTFGHWQQDLANQFPGKVVFKQTAGTVADSEWMDELHANATGFRKLARVFAA
jgi:hypothetical protein